jgi:hypothetical protein
MNTWAKLSTGEWGVLTNSRPAVGDTLTVSAKGGKTSTVTVARVYTRRDKFVCEIVRSTGGNCAQCGRHATDLTTRYDMSGIAGKCCPTCASLSRYDLIFA